MKNIKAIIRNSLHVLGRHALPKVRFGSLTKYRVLGDGGHIFVGYYDHDPVGPGGDHVLCHRVAEKFTQYVEPPIGEVGLLSLHDGSFKPIANTSALNWQLGSRLQWFSDETMAYNDLVDGTQTFIIRNISTGRVEYVHEYPFWAVSPDKRYGVSLNFARLRTTRPGYGYAGDHRDGTKEKLRVYQIDTEALVHETLGCRSQRSGPR